MPEVTETHLPGVGVRHEFATDAGERVAVLSHRTGRREIAIYDRADPDSCTTVLRLDPEDTRTLVSLLGGGALSEAAAGVQRLAGVALDWVPIKAGTPYAGSTIGETRLRTRTGSSVVAVIRGEETIPAPGPEQALAAEDVVVAIGTPEGLREARHLLGA